MAWGKLRKILAIALYFLLTNIDIGQAKANIGNSIISSADLNDMGQAIENMGNDILPSAGLNVVCGGRGLG